jgi:hypothetical protein
MTRQGLVDIKVTLAEDLTGATTESICGEINALLDAHERGDSQEFTFGDSRRTAL